MSAKPKMLKILERLLDLFLLLFARKTGKDAAEKEAAKDELEAIDEKNTIHDRVARDPDYRDRVRERFRR